MDAGAPVAPLTVHRIAELIAGHGKGCQAGLVFNPASSLDVLGAMLDQIDCVLLLSVNPGFGGQSFIPSALKQLRKVRAMIDACGKPIRLEIDGAVKPDNIGEIAQAGADTFVASSAILGQPGHGH